MAAMTAREFNNYTGRAKLLAREAPVFVTERGTVQYVLLNIDEYKALRGIGKSLAELSMVDDDKHYSYDFDGFLPKREDLDEREVEIS